MVDFFPNVFINIVNIAKNNSEAARILGLDLKQYRNYLSEFGYSIKTWERK